MSRRKYPSERAERFLVRLPDGMRDRLAEEAKRNGRSMNSEAVARLAMTFGEAPAAAPADVSAGAIARAALAWFAADERRLLAGRALCDADV